MCTFPVGIFRNTPNLTGYYIRWSKRWSQSLIYIHVKNLHVMHENHVH